uniref:Uncharacterized protein n=1 Tax=Glossina palpalis gambiensis TaxID=67801 RepID=A0A1B0BXD9_9MUSC
MGKKVDTLIFIQNSKFLVYVQTGKLQKNGAGSHTASFCYWNSDTDGSCTIGFLNLCFPHLNSHLHLGSYLRLRSY